MEVIRHHYVNDKRKGDKWMNMDEGMSLTYKPLYVQVKDRLLEMIERKELRFGEKLPSEPDLAKMFGVSRSTVREAIRVLSQEGAVIVRHGLGTFVAGSQFYVRRDLSTLRSITWAIKQRGWTPGTINAEMYEDVADSELAEKLQIAQSAPIICVTRVRTADSHKVFYSVHKMAKEPLGNKILKWNMDGSFLEFLKYQCDIDILYAVSTVLPVKKPEEITEKLGIDPTTPILLLDQIHYDVSNKPIFRSYDYYRTDIFEFNVVRRIR